MASLCVRISCSAHCILAVVLARLLHSIYAPCALEVGRYAQNSLAFARLPDWAEENFAQTLVSSLSAMSMVVQYFHCDQRWSACRDEKGQAYQFPFFVQLRSVQSLCHTLTASSHSCLGNLEGWEMAEEATCAKRGLFGTCCRSVFRLCASKDPTHNGAGHLLWHRAASLRLSWESSNSNL